MLLHIPNQTQWQPIHTNTKQKQSGRKITRNRKP